PLSDPFLFRETAPTAIYTLSLHDALPILAGQRFDIVGAAERVDDVGDPAFMLQDQLCIAGDAAGKLGRQRDGFIKAVGMEALRRSEEHTSELQSRENLVCRLLLEKKKTHI